MKIKYSVISLVLVLALCSFSQAATKVLEWKFDGDLSDSSGNGLDGSEYTMDGNDHVTYEAGISGDALVTDGNECALVTGVDTSLLPVLMDDAWTVNIWVYCDAKPLNWRIAWCLGVKPYYGGAGYERCLYSGSASTIVFANLSDIYISPPEPWDVGKWQMVTTTFDGTYVRVYKNGILLARALYDTFEDAAGEVRVATNYGSSSYPTFFAGKFDEFTVWRGAMTQEEIINLIPEDALIDHKGPAYELAHYTMGDPNLNSNKLPDHSGNGKDGNIISGYTSPIEDWVAPGAKSASLAFQGGQEVNVPSSAVATVGVAQYSIAFWLKAGWQQYQSAFYEERYPSNGCQLIIRGDAGTNGAMKIYSKDLYYGMEYIMSYDASAYLTGKEWHHLALTVDGNSTTAKWYMDGELVSSATTTTSIGLRKTIGTVGHIGASTQVTDPNKYLGKWDRAYIDDLHIYRGVLTQDDILALMDESNLDNDFDVDYEDLAVMADEWLSPSTQGNTLTVSDFESSLTGWYVGDSETYTGTGNISLTTNAYAGSNGAMQWDYNLPAQTGGNYTSLIYDLGANTDLTAYDVMKLQLYRHAGNAPEDVMFIQFARADGNSVAEVWNQDANCVVSPENQWDEWYIDMNKQFYKLYTNGAISYVRKSVLTSVRYITIGCGGETETARTGSIDIDEIKLYDSPLCSPYLTSDLNFDCKVNFNDFATFADGWVLKE